MIYYKHTERMLCEILIKGVCFYETGYKKNPEKSFTGTSQGCSRNPNRCDSLLNL